MREPSKPPKIRIRLVATGIVPAKELPALPRSHEGKYESMMITSLLREGVSEFFLQFLNTLTLKIHLREMTLIYPIERTITISRETNDAS